MRAACQVVPEIPSFAVDDGFTYLIPDGTDISVGSKVRVRVSGRRLAGYVTALIDAPTTRKLLSIDSVSGDIPLFDDQLLEVCRWAATHYVAPLSVLLRRTGPPNVARYGRHDVAVKSNDTASGARTVTYAISRSPHTDVICSAVQDVPEDCAVGVLVPTASEVVTVSAALRRVYGERVLTATSSMKGSQITDAWVAGATRPGTILVGTREIALWPLHNEQAWILVEEGRRVMKSPSTPTIHVREILGERMTRRGGALHVIGPMPTLEILAMEPDVAEPPGRWWPPVEVVDRTLEPPSASLFTEHAKRVITAAVADRKRTFVLVAARGYAPAFRCIACGTLRKCQVCETTASSEDRCRRCGAPHGRCTACNADRFEPLGAGIGRVIDDLSRFAGSDNVAEADSDAVVLVGSERDLVDVGPVDLAVVVDIDGMAGAPHYRAREDALRLVARLANRADGGGGRRLLLQTSSVNQPVVVAMGLGNANDFLADESAVRSRAGFPPFGQLIAIETSDTSDSEADAIIRSEIDTLGTVRGPAAMRDRSRWLVSGDSLAEARIVLRRVVGTLRSKGAKVRIDADPIDL